MSYKFVLVHAPMLTCKARPNQPNLKPTYSSVFGYIPTDIDHIIYRGSALSMDLIVTSFRQRGSTTGAFNTSLRLRPSKGKNPSKKILTLEYFQIKNQKRLPSPYQRLRVVNIVPRKSPIFQEILAGNLVGVRFLIENQMASVYDEDPLQFTPLHVSPHTYWCSF